jgi:hypothetical protein
MVVCCGEGAWQGLVRSGGTVSQGGGMAWVGGATCDMGPQ